MKAQSKEEEYQVTNEQTGFNPQDTLVVLYGSRSGNAQKIANLTHAYAKYTGLNAQLVDMQSFDFKLCEELQNLLLIVSTHGEGEPPYTAEAFYEWIHSDSAPNMEKCTYSVLALGDSSYKLFCKTGIDMDIRLEELSAKRLQKVATCDLDFNQDAMEWIEKTVGLFTESLPVTIDPERGSFMFQLVLDNSGSESGYLARIEEKKLLNPGSSKKTLHLRLSIRNSELNYFPGDSVGIHCKNSRWLVDKLLMKLKLDPASTVIINDTPKLLKTILIEEFELTVITSKVMRDYAEISNNKRLIRAVTDKDFVRGYTQNHDVLDLVSDYPSVVTATDLLAFLRKLPPRLYSAACSQKINQESVEITVGVVSFEKKDRMYDGVCTDMLLGRVDKNNFIPIYIDSNPGFYLPEDPDIPIIMIATGTGIAPFRAFLQERKAINASGQNWLFFGDRNRDSDFIYKDELKEFMNDGVLTRIHTAFSRDQKEKIYIGDVIEKNGHEIIKWVEKGAILYICGNKRTMAVNVKNSLLKVFQQCYGMNATDAETHYKKMKKEKKIREDIY